MACFHKLTVGLIALFVTATVLGNSVQTTVSHPGYDQGCACHNGGIGIWLNGTGTKFNENPLKVSVESEKHYIILVEAALLDRAGVLPFKMAWMSDRSDNARFSFDPQEVDDNSPQDQDSTDERMRVLFKITAPKEPGSYFNVLVIRGIPVLIEVTVNPSMYYSEVTTTATTRTTSATSTTSSSTTTSTTTNYHLDVNTEPAGVTDVTASGWFAPGSSVSISPVPAEVQDGSGRKYVFNGWMVDGASRSDNGFVIIMDASHVVVAKFDTMFLLTILSDYGNPKGAGYYKSGDTATFSIESPAGVFGMQEVFVEWKGDYSSKDPKGSLTMNRPKTVIAVWATTSFELYLATGAGAIVVLQLLSWTAAVRRKKISNRHDTDFRKPTVSQVS